MENHVHKHEECKKYLSLLSEYVDDNLDKNLCARLEAHMADCEDCTIVVNTLKRTVDLYRTTAKEPNESLPEDVKSRLFKRLSIDDLLQ